MFQTQFKAKAIQPVGRALQTRRWKHDGKTDRGRGLSDALAGRGEFSEEILKKKTLMSHKTIVERKVIMWKYETDSERLAVASTQAVINEIMRHNASMMFESSNCGEEETLHKSIDFLEKCKARINMEIDKQISQIKERM